MQKLTDNHFTTLGTSQFIEDTRMLTNVIGDIVKKDDVVISSTEKIVDALLLMTKTKLGAVAVMNPDHSLHRVFTDGDLRRLMHENGENVHNMSLKDLNAQSPVFIHSDASLYDARKAFYEKGVDTLVVMNGNEFAGLIDIHQVI